MRTVTYQIQHWTHEDTGSGDCFEVMECETLHIVGSAEEHSAFGIASFGTRPEAETFIKTVLA